MIACVDAVSPDKRAVCSGVTGVPDGLIGWELWATAGCKYTGRGPTLPEAESEGIVRWENPLSTGCMTSSAAGSLVLRWYPDAVSQW